MERRTFISLLSSIAVLPAFAQKTFADEPANKFILPDKLNTGDIVGIIAPGTAIKDPDQIAKVNETMNYFGLKAKFGKTFSNKEGYLSSSIEARVDDIHSMFADNNVKAVFCIRGGYGSIQLLDKINYELIKKNPKIFVGYSDITALHLAINKFSNLITFHGPVAISSFSAYTIGYFKKALFDNKPAGVISNPDTKNNFRLVHPVRTIVPGKAKGRITGGNLSLISATMGTPFEIETKGKILCIEDVGEEPYRIDRMLAQLHLSKKLEDASGIVFGECTECNYEGIKSSRVWDDSLGEVLDKYFGKLNKPVFYGLTFGHTSDQITLPFGVNTELDSVTGTLNIIESATL